MDGPEGGKRGIGWRLGLLKSVLGSWGFNCTGDIDYLSLGVQKGYSEVDASKNDDSGAQEIWDEGLRQREREKRVRLRSTESEAKHISRPNGRKEKHAYVVDGKLHWQYLQKFTISWMVLGVEGEASKLTLGDSASKKPAFHRPQAGLGRMLHPLHCSDPGRHKYLLVRQVFV